MEKIYPEHVVIATEKEGRRSFIRLANSVITTKDGAYIGNNLEEENC